MKRIQERGVTHPQNGASPCVTSVTPRRPTLREVAKEATLSVEAVLLDAASRHRVALEARGLPFFLTPTLAANLLGLTTASLEAALKAEGADPLPSIERQARGLHRVTLRKQRGRRGEVLRVTLEDAPARSAQADPEVWVRLTPQAGDPSRLLAALRMAQEARGGARVGGGGDARSAGAQEPARGL